MPLTVEVVSPEKILFSGEGEMVICRTIGGGDIAFQPGHIPFIGALATWSVRVIGADGSTAWIAVHGGFVEVSNDRVTILSDVAELPEDIDLRRAETALDRAMAAVRDNPDDAEAKADVARAEVRIQVVAGAPVGSSH